MVTWTVSIMENTGCLKQLTPIKELKIMVAWTVAPYTIGWLKPLTPVKKLRTWWLEQAHHKKNCVAQTVNTHEKATNMVAWISTIENRVAPTVNTRERTTPVEEQILAKKNTGKRMSPTMSKGKQQNMTIHHVTWHTKLTPEQHTITLMKLCSYLWDNF